MSWPLIKCGDLVLVKKPGALGKLLDEWFIPGSAEMHLIVVGDYVPEENDFLIIESIPRHGVQIGRLSWYAKDTVRIFRPSPDFVPLYFNGTPEELGVRAFHQATKYGKDKYDFRIILTVVWITATICMRNWASGRGWHVSYTDFPNTRDQRVICTELGYEAYRDLFPVVDSRYLPLPCNFIASYEKGLLNHIGGW